MRRDDEKEMALLENAIEFRLHTAISDLILRSKDHKIIEVLKNESSYARKTMVEEYVPHLRSCERFHELCLLDATGKEVTAIFRY